MDLPVRSISPMSSGADARRRAVRNVGEGAVVGHAEHGRAGEAAGRPPDAFDYGNAFAAHAQVGRSKAAAYMAPASA